MKKKMICGLVAAIFIVMLASGCGEENKGQRPAAANAQTVQAKQESVVNLNAETTKQLNTFFSNFSETALQPFAAGQISEAALIDFAVQHNILNRKQAISDGKLSAKEVDNACQKYFGTKPKSHHSTGSYQYANGFYSVPQASGEAIRFSQVVSLTDHGYGTYAAVVNVFNASSGFTGNPHGTPNEWRASGEVPKLAEKMNAIVKKVSENGTDRWVLVEYAKQ